MRSPKKAMTVRLPLDLYQAAARTANRRRISLSGLVQQSLRDTLAHEKRQQLCEAFSRVAYDSDEGDVEFAFEAQAEVVRGGES